MKKSIADSNSSNFSSSSWSNLPGVKQKFNESADPVSGRKKELNVIEERSNENSESSSKNGVPCNEGDSKTVNENTGRNSLMWWTWNQNTNNNNTKNIEQPIKEVNIDDSNGWINWNSYNKVGSVVSYIYTRNSVIEPKEQLQEPNKSIGPAEHIHTSDTAVTDENSEGTLTECNVEENNTSWFNWGWFSKNTFNDDADEENITDLYKSAKLTIETSKDTSYYAFKALRSYKTVREIELAVSNTLTEIQPVRYSSKRRPLTPNEIQERSLVSQPHNGAINSSRSSINSEASHPQNYIIPKIDDNYRIITWKTKARLFGEHILYNENTSERHTYRNTEANINYKREKVIKKVVIVGVHSFLPIKLVKGLIGDSTGNSIKYVNEAAEAVKEWFSKNTSEESDINIETIALEGEGMIEERVSKLYKLMENWMQSINNCDFLFFLSHSQGTIVAIHLLAEILSHHPSIAKKKIGLLSMSGMINGPFSGLDSKLVVRAFTTIENEIISELFDLQKPNSLPSAKLNKSMAILVKHGVKIVLSGALNDQFVPISSSLGVGYTHPNIHRFLYVHHKCDLPPFLISLFRIAITMRNMGRTDYNLLRDLSDYCMGTLSEGGHGKIYKDRQVYATSIRYILETTRPTYTHHIYVDAVTCGRSVSTLSNLPLSLRSLIHQVTLTKNICNAKLISQLIQDFKQWSPTQKSWKELKYCFEALDDASLEDFVL